MRLPLRLPRAARWLGPALSLLLAACQTAAPTPTLAPTAAAPPTASAAAMAAATARPSATPPPTAAVSATAATSAELMAGAWQAYGADNFARAVTLSQECVARWEGEAIQQQAALTQAPLTGTVSAADKSAILANWALNDVGAAYFVIGSALQQQGRAAEAAVAFEKTRLFPYARVWDPQGGFFWAPAAAASDSLATVRPATATPPPTATSTPTVTPTRTHVPPTRVPTTAASTSALKSSAELVAAAWQAYGANNFALAIDLAQECANRYAVLALQQQAALTQPPPTGAVSAADQQAIFANWALNDVGTAYFILGQSQEKLGQAGAAAAAYAKVKQFPYARAWDPRGWFWSPAEAVPG